MKLKKIAALIALAGLSGSAFATNGYFGHGYGMKAKGMGGVGIAYGQDAMAAATNPANMVLIGNRWDVGVDYFRPQREASIAGSPGGFLDGKYDGNASENYFVPEFGYNKMIANNMSLGVSVYGNGGMATDYKNNPYAGFTGGPGTVGNAGVDLAQLMIAPTWSYKLNENHAIGVSLKIAYQRFEAFGLQAFTAPGFSAFPTKMTNNGHDSSWGWGIGIGWTGQITPTVKLGATYQSKTSMQEFDDYKGLFAEKGGFDIPENYGIGISWQATPQLVVAADVTQINFSKINSVGNPLIFPPAGAPLGTSKGAGFGWDDMTVYKIGFAYDLNKEWTVRAGYNYSSQPIPNSQTFFNILAPATVEDHLTLGATWRLASGGEVTFAYMHAFEETVKGSGSLAPLGMPGNANLKMYEDSFGVAYGVKF
jgi:long-chain fatty acid transport protein